MKLKQKKDMLIFPNPNYVTLKTRLVEDAYTYKYSAELRQNLVSIPEKRFENLCKSNYIRLSNIALTVFDPIYHENLNLN
jgi:hypothetical protein